MYRREDKEQIGMEEFLLPFEGHLDNNNRWVKLSKLIPWDYKKAIEEYIRNQLQDDIAGDQISNKSTLTRLRVSRKKRARERASLETASKRNAVGGLFKAA